jgi:hypothetical protein
MDGWLKFEIQFDCNVRFNLKFGYVRSNLTKFDSNLNYVRFNLGFNLV